MKRNNATKFHRKSGVVQWRDLLFRPSTREILTINAEYDPLAEVSSRPERTRISCHAALDKAARAPFRKEGRMKRNNATKFHRKSGVVQWRDLLLILRSIQFKWKRNPLLCHPDRSAPGFPATLHWTKPRVRPSVKKGA